MCKPCTRRSVNYVVDNTLKLTDEKILAIILAFFALNANSQIRIFQQNDLPVETEKVFQDMEAEDEQVDKSNDLRFDSIRIGFKNFDMNMLKPFLTKGLQSETLEIEKVFAIYTEIFNSRGNTTFKYRKYDGFSKSGTSGLARFVNSDRRVGTLEFKYTYKGQRPVISEILVLNDGRVKYGFPLIESKIKTKLKEIKVSSDAQDYPETILRYKELISLTQNLESYYHNPNEGLIKKSRYHGNLSWYYLLSGNAKKGIEYAEKGIEIWYSNTWINTNLALGFALDGNFEEASNLYSKYGNYRYKGDKYYKDIFIEDLKHLNSINIIVPRYEDYINQLEKM